MEQNRIQVIKGDITQQEVDAIVNAANVTLLGGGGVDGAIHRAAGPELLEACRKLEGCATGQAKITSGFHLAATWVIHTVGPVWKGGQAHEEELLASCYRNSLLLAKKCFVRTIAFPSISTGAYGFPVKQASKIAVREAAQYLKEDRTMERIVFVCFDKATYDCYQEALKNAA